MSKMRFFALQALANRRPLEVITPSNKLSDYYGSHVFDRKKMHIAVRYTPRQYRSQHESDENAEAGCLQAIW